jgi:hypothetical protein
MRAAQTRKLRATGVGLALAAVATLFAACGGSDSPGVTSLGSTTTTTAQSAPANAGNGGDSCGAALCLVRTDDGNPADLVKFSICMRAHGVVDYPEPGSNGSISVSATLSQSPLFQAADNTCRKLLPNGGIPTAAQQAEGLAQLLKVSICMRAHGISDFPDPTAEGIRIPVPKNPGSDLSPNNPRFQAAEKACQSLGP